MIGGLRQLRAIWAHRGFLKNFGHLLRNRAVQRAAADIGSDVVYHGVKLARKSKGNLISRAFRSKKFRKGMFAFDFGTSVGFGALALQEGLNVRKMNAQRQAAVRKFQKNLNKTEQRLQRVRRVGE